MILLYYEEQFNWTVYDFCAAVILNFLHNVMTTPVQEVLLVRAWTIDGLAKSCLWII